MDRNAAAPVDTIAALSSGSLPAGVAVIRVSGPRAGHCVEQLTGQPPPLPGSFSLRTFAWQGEPIDQGLVLWFARPKSFTGEDVAEFQTHGGRAVVDAMLAALGTMDGVRFAEAGEFSRQAFQNGRLDLTAVEGLSDLIQAETFLQRRQAFAQMNGALAGIYERWRAELIRALGHIEAGIDFADEELPADLSMQAIPILSKLREEIRSHLHSGQLGERVRNGFRVAIFGRPNVGKSSLLNFLAQRDVAIVSDIPGTTRDFLEVELNIGGIPVTVVDTAGLRESDDEIERLGVERAWGQIEKADVTVGMRELGEPDIGLGREGVHPDLVLVNKIDLETSPVMSQCATEFAVSVKTGAGIDAFLGALEDVLRERLARKPEVVPTRLRHRLALGRSVESLERALRVSPEAIDILAEEVRLAMVALGEITGRSGVEDMLDVVFSDFCIGK